FQIELHAAQVTVGHALEIRPPADRQVLLDRRTHVDEARGRLLGLVFAPRQLGRLQHVRLNLIEAVGKDNVLKVVLTIEVDEAYLSRCQVGRRRQVRGPQLPHREIAKKLRPGEEEPVWEALFLADDLPANPPPDVSPTLAIRRHRYDAR